MTADSPITDLHHHVARFVVALARIVHLVRRGDLADTDAEHQGGYAVDAVRQFAVQTDGAMHVTFTSGVPFVKRAPLHAAAWVFPRLEPLARALHSHGWSDLRVEPTARPEDIVALAMRIAADHDDEGSDIPHVTLGGESFGDLANVLPLDRSAPPTTLSVAYSSVVAALWDAQSGVSRGTMPPLARLMRAAQVVVSLAETRRLSASMPTSARLQDDPAARWVDTTVVSVEMCRLITRDPHRLRAVALAGLLLALTPFDERGVADKDGPPSLGGDRRIASSERLAAATLALIAGIRHVARTARLAATIAYEAQRCRYAFLGSGRSPGGCVEARALATAVRFSELCRKQRETEPIDTALAALRPEAAGGRDDPILRLLLAALDVIPRGAVVELSGGDVAVVRSPAREALPPEPEVELRVDEKGESVRPGTFINLSRSARASEARPGISSVLALFDDVDVLPAAGSRDLPATPTAEESHSAKPAARRLLGPMTPPSRGPPSRPPASRRAQPLDPDILEDIVGPHASSSDDDAK